MKHNPFINESIEEYGIDNFSEPKYKILTKGWAAGMYFRKFKDGFPREVTNNFFKEILR